MNITRLFTCSLLAAALLMPASAESKASPFQPVEKSVRERTGLSVRWQQNAAAREDALKEVHALLKQPLTATTAVRIALLNNRDLLASLEDVGVSAADLREAGLWKNPSVDLSVRFPDRSPRVPNWEEGIAFDVLDLLVLPLRKKVAADQLAAAQLRVADEILRVVTETKQAVYTLQADVGILAYRKSIVEIEASTLELTQRQHAAGNISDVSLAQQQAAYNAARLDFSLAENDEREHREKLTRLLGLWGADTAWTVNGQLPKMPEGDVPLRGLESLAVAQRLDLGAAQMELASVIRALGLTKKYRYLGALSFGVDSERDPDRTTVTGPRLSLELPIFNQGQARVAKGEAELRRAERKVESLAIGIRSDVRALRDKLGAQREMVHFYTEEVVPTRHAIYAGMLLQYNGMLIGNFQLFDARSEEVNAENQARLALRDYWITRAELERAVGGNLKARAGAKNPSPGK